MRYLSFCLMLAGVTTAAAQTPSSKGGDKIVPEPITLTGCVAAGTRPNTFVLSNVLRADKPVGTSGTDVLPRTDQPVGTSGTAALPPFYWFDSPAKLSSHVGHQVLITGMLDDDVDQTDVKVKDGKVQLKTEGGRKVEVPVGTSGASGLGTDGMKRTTYKVKVGSVRMLSGTCSQ